MTKSELFKAAHAQAKATVATVGNYQIAFKLALIAVYAEQKAPKNVNIFSEDLLDELKFTAMDTPCFEHIFIDETDSCGIENIAFRAYHNDGVIVLLNGDVYDYSRASRKTGRQTWNGDDVVTNEVARTYKLGEKVGKITVKSNVTLEDAAFDVLEQIYHLVD